MTSIQSYESSIIASTTFMPNCKMVNFNLSISRHCQLEWNNLNNSQYNRREALENNPVPSDIADNVLKQSVCQMLSLTGIYVVPDNLQYCHCMKEGPIIIKFKCRKQKHQLISNCKTLQNKSLELTQLKFFGNLFINE